MEDGGQRTKQRPRNHGAGGGGGGQGAVMGSHERV